MRRRFRKGVSLTGREAQEFAALVAQDCILPLPFHLLFLSFCHVVVLLYASNVGLPLGVWQAWGKIHVYLLHLIMEYAERGSQPRFISMALHTHLANHTCRSNTAVRLGSTICVSLMSYILSSRPVKAGGHKFSCGKLSGGHWCWNRVFSGRRLSGVSLWSAFCGHCSTANREGPLPPVDPIAAIAPWG